MSAAYAPSRFQTPRSAKIVVQSPVSVTRALNRILRAAAIARSANCRRPSNGSSTFSLNFCSIANVGEAVSSLREMKLQASLIANLPKEGDLEQLIGPASAERLRLLANQRRDLLRPVFKTEPVAVRLAAQINIAVFNYYPKPLMREEEDRDQRQTEDREPGVNDPRSRVVLNRKYGGRRRLLEIGKDELVHAVVHELLHERRAGVFVQISFGESPDFTRLAVRREVVQKRRSEERRVG